MLSINLMICERITIIKFNIKNEDGCKSDWWSVDQWKNLYIKSL